jgi:hypothetical protein
MKSVAHALLTWTFGGKYGNIQSFPIYVFFLLNGTWLTTFLRLCIYTLFIHIFLKARGKMSQQQPDSESPIVKHTVDTSPDEALKYWTADKKRKAKPAPQPHSSDLRKPQAPPSPQAPDAPKS